MFFLCVFLRAYDTVVKAIHVHTDPQNIHVIRMCTKLPFSQIAIFLSLQGDGHDIEPHSLFAFSGSQMRLSSK